jgi:hypothetical protein
MRPSVRKAVAELLRPYPVAAASAADYATNGESRR